jgi:hypothetical protein
MGQLKRNSQESPYRNQPPTTPINSCRILLTKPNEQKGIFSMKCDRKTNIKGKMGVIMAYLDTLTSLSPKRTNEKHGKHLTTDGFRARIQNIHLLHINSVHYCCSIKKSEIPQIMAI